MQRHSYFIAGLITICLFLSLAVAQAQDNSSSSTFTGGQPAAKNLPQRGDIGSTVFAASTWSDQSAHLLDAGLSDLGSFPVAASNPNGVASSGDLIYIGFFTTSEVIAYDSDGVEQFRWSGSLGTLQGMAIVGAELAIANGDIQFYDPANGTLIRTIPSTTPSVEGLAYDGTLLWALGDTLDGLNPADGSVVESIPNPASSCSFSGTALAYDGENLAVGCDDGSWFLVNPSTGSVVQSGSNTLNMFGLAATAEPAAPLPVAVAVPATSFPSIVLLIGLVVMLSAVVLPRMR